MSNFQKKIIKEYESKGYLVLKHIRLNKSGYPDLQCIKKVKLIFGLNAKKKTTH